MRIPFRRVDRRRAVAQQRFAVVQIVFHHLFFRRDVGHDHVCARKKALFAAAGVQDLQSRGSGNVDVRHKQAQQRYHLEPEGEAPFGRRIRGAREREGRLRMRIVGPHADHRSVELLVEQQVVGHVFRRLERHTYHSPRTCLITNLFEIVKRLETAVVRMVRRVNLSVQVGV